MQKAVIKVITEFCAERTKAVAVGEYKYVTFNISSFPRSVNIEEKINENQTQLLTWMPVDHTREV